MLIRNLEYLLINFLNGTGRRRAGAGKQPPASPVAPPDDYAVLGHLIPEAEAASRDPVTNDPVTRQLSDAGVVALSPEARMRHLYLLGATGTGKTNLLLRLIETDIRNRRTFCVVDLRGDLVDRILLRLAAAAPAEHWRQRLMLVDLRNSEHAVGFNPLAAQSDPRQGDTYTRALLLLSVLKKQSDSWGVQLEDTLRHALMALAETGWSLLEVRPLLTIAAFRQQVLAGVDDTQVRAYFEEWERLSAAERNSRSGAALNKLSPILSVPALRLMFGQRQGFSFSALLDHQPGMVILVSLGVDRLHDAARLAGGLIISSLQNAIMARVDQPEAERVPAHLYVDEFECMASDKFEEIVAEGRRFRVGLTLSHQNLSQLPLGLRHVIRNNVHTQVYFQTGAVDAGELAKEIGHGKGSAEVRAALMSQGLGEAFLVRRGQTAARMQTLRCDDPKVGSQRLQELRATSLTTYARPRAEIERELRERDEKFRCMAAAQTGQPSGASGAGSSSAGPPGTAVYHIRHSKTSHFPPRTAPIAGPDPENKDADCDLANSSAINSDAADSEAVAPIPPPTVSADASADMPPNAAPSAGPANRTLRPTLKPDDTGGKNSGRKSRKKTGAKNAAAKNASEPEMNGTAPKKRAAEVKGGEISLDESDGQNDDPTNATQ